MGLVLYLENIGNVTAPRYRLCGTRHAAGTVANPPCENPFQVLETSPIGHYGNDGGPHALTPAFPTLCDLDGDGLLDLLVTADLSASGAYQRRRNSYNYRVQYWRNVGHRFRARFERVVSGPLFNGTDLGTQVSPVRVHAFCFALLT